MHSHQLRTRVRVQEKLGEPVETKRVPGGSEEKYISRKQFARQKDSQFLLMGAGLTLGASEIVALPLVLSERTWALIGGQEVHVFYDESGKTTRIDIDGETFEDVFDYVVDENVVSQGNVPIQDGGLLIKKSDSKSQTSLFDDTEEFFP